MTDAERKLWRGLRDKQLEGHRFRRQVPVGPYIVDFASKPSRMVVEVDGAQHVQLAERDAARTAYLQSNGFRLLRFWDDDVLQRTDEVLEAIRLALREAQSG